MAKYIHGRHTDQPTTGSLRQKHAAAARSRLNHRGLVASREGHAPYLHVFFKY